MRSRQMPARVAIIHFDPPIFFLHLYTCHICDIWQLWLSSSPTKRFVFCIFAFSILVFIHFCISIVTQSNRAGYVAGPAEAQCPSLSAGNLCLCCFEPTFGPHQITLRPYSTLLSTPGTIFFLHMCYVCYMCYVFTYKCYALILLFSWTRVSTIMANARYLS